VLALGVGDTEKPLGKSAQKAIYFAVFSRILRKARHINRINLSFLFCKLLTVSQL
jgi:hypothetical protein